MTVPNPDFCYSWFIPQNKIPVPNYKRTSECDRLKPTFRVISHKVTTEENPHWWEM